MTQLGISVASADEPTPLTEQEIVARLFGNSLQQSYKTSSGEYPGLGTMTLYIARDGKVLLQDDDSGPVPMIAMGTATAEDGRFCLHWPEVVEPDLVKRNVCYQVSPDPDDSDSPQDVYLSFSGREQSFRMQLLPGDDRELGSLWTKWERIFATTRDIDSRPRMDAIAAAPEKFKGEILMLQGKFLRMVTPEMADFQAYTNSGRQHAFRLDGVRDDLFLGEEEDFLIFATLTAILRRTGEFGRDTQMTLSAKLVLPCTQLLCRDWLGMRH
ncbi:MAG TPA: hypothetical protein VEC60_00865 [Reyranella sp.]|nr:hypothetical protein [Reyranella sp.]